jgi:DNA processing protein
VSGASVGAPQNAPDDIADRWQLLQSANVGPVTYRQLLQRFGSAANALKALPDLSRRGGGRELQVADRSRIEAQLAQMTAQGIQLLCHDDAHYPEQLRQSGNAPPILLCQGNVALLGRPLLAIVGARNASAAALGLARMIAADIADRFGIIVSGLARGIDTAAHQGASPGRTIAVIAGGHDAIFPPENAQLQADIARHGLVISEHPPGTTPTARHFPHRNRIIAALGYGTLVVEAAERSGSLITARLAGEYGREVMAVPGSPLDPRSRGCNSLIRDGATLVQDASDIIELLLPFDPSVPAFTGQHLAEPEWDYFDEANAPLLEPSRSDRETLHGLLSFAPVAVAELIRLSGQSAASVQMLLIELELAGKLVRHAGNRVSRRPD